MGMSWNVLLERCHKLLTMAAASANTKFLFVFQEDIVSVRGLPPLVSPFCDEDFAHTLKQYGGISVAALGCSWSDQQDCPPLRLASNFERLQTLGVAGWLTFDKQNCYQGSLPKCCGHTGQAAWEGQGYTYAPSLGNDFCSMAAALIFVFTAESCAQPTKPRCTSAASAPGGPLQS